MSPANTASFSLEYRQYILRTATIATYGDLGRWTYDSYIELNERYFGGAVRPNTVQWGLTPHGKALGFYSPTFDTITLHQSLVQASRSENSNPWGLGSYLGKKLALDVLLHEMIHQFLHQQGRCAEDDDAHHCQAWCDEVKRVGKLLGLPGYYYAGYRKTTKRVPIRDRVIVGKYCDLDTHRVHKPKTKQVSTWVLVDEDARPKAEELGLKVATRSQLTMFPQRCRPASYYSEEEQQLLETSLIKVA